MSSTQIVVKFCKNTKYAISPMKGSDRAAGYDLYSAYDYDVPPCDRALIRTDISVSLPSGCYGRIAPRSGLALNNFVDVGGGVVDPDYRGQIGVILFNFGSETFPVRRGDRVAQLILEKIHLAELEEVRKDELDVTVRGDKGFGSTGKR